MKCALLPLIVTIAALPVLEPPPASASDLAAFRTFYAQKLGLELDRQREIAGGAAYKAGEPDAVVARHRLHFKPALKRSADYERLMSAMRAAFVSQGSAGILKARAVEDRLLADTWLVSGYDLLGRVRTLNTPTLVMAGDADFIPPAIAGHHATALPKARLVTFKDCGHFAYLECPTDVRRALAGFFQP